MGRRALSEEEKLQRAKEKETQRELYEKQYNDFSNAKLCDLVDGSILKMFYMKISRLPLKAARMCFIFPVLLRFLLL